MLVFGSLFPATSSASLRRLHDQDELSVGGRGRERGQADGSVRLLESLLVHCRADKRELGRVDEVGWCITSTWIKPKNLYKDEPGHVSKISFRIGKRDTRLRIVILINGGIGSGLSSGQKMERTLER